MEFLLKNGLLIDPSADFCGKIDILVKDGKVYKADNILNLNHYEVIDCSEKIVVPGFIDVHTHLRDPGFEYKEDISSGTKAALAGGVTTVFCMPNTVPVVDNLATINYIVEKSKKYGMVNVLPIAAMTIGSKGYDLVDFDSLLDAGAVSFSDDGRWVHDSLLMLKMMEFSAKSGVRVIQHCEDAGIVAGGVINNGVAAQKLGLPPIAGESEDVAVYRDVALCGLAGAKLHIAHISTAESLRIVEDARRRGIDVTCEVAPHHLLLDDECIVEDNADYKVNPPIRSKSDKEYLIDGVKRGVIDVFATDHAPHAEYEKAQGFRRAPFGMVGLEFSFSLLYTYLVKKDIMSLPELIKMMSFNPAKIFNLTAKGSLIDGSCADIAVIDLNANYKIDKTKLLSKSVNTPFDGVDVYGKVTDVFVNGELKYNNGKIYIKKESVYE